MTEPVPSQRPAEVLAEWLLHGTLCAVRGGYDYPCTCGMDDALASLAAPPDLAEAVCPCEDGLPDPCTLCGAAADTDACQLATLRGWEHRARTAEAALASLAATPEGLSEADRKFIDSLPGCPPSSGAWLAERGILLAVIDRLAPRPEKDPTDD